MTTSKKKKSIVLLSGGLDSAANLALCHRWDSPLLALTFDYGQRAREREVRAAQDLCKHFNVNHQVISLPWLGNLGGSALTQESRWVPKLKLSDLDDEAKTQQTAKEVWVPNRNGVFINIAASFAEEMGAPQIVVGFNCEEAVTFPDNSLNFIERVNHALSLSTLAGVEVVSYTVHLNKTQIVANLLDSPQPFPWKLVWSCYEGGSDPCRQCESCLRFQRATRSVPVGQIDGKS